MRAYYYLRDIARATLNLTVRAVWRFPRHRTCFVRARARPETSLLHSFTVAPTAVNVRAIIRAPAHACTLIYNDRVAYTLPTISQREARSPKRLWRRETLRACTGRPVRVRARMKKKNPVFRPRSICVPRGLSLVERL